MLTSITKCCLCWESFMLCVIHAECCLCWFSFMLMLFVLSIIYVKCYVCWVSLWRMCDMLSYQLSPSAFSKNIILYVSFLSYSPIKIVSQKMVILSSLSQNWPVGFSNGQFLWRTPSSVSPQCTHTRTLSFSVSLAACLFPLLSVRV